MSSPSDKIIIIAAPSGAGKTSIVRFLLNRFETQLGFSISCATRSPRANEKEGVDYYFISAENFKQKISEDQFAEWEMVYQGKYYGTLRSELSRIWSEKKVPLLDIDVKGGLRVKENYPPGSFFPTVVSFSLFTVSIVSFSHQLSLFPPLYFLSRPPPLS